MQDSATFCVLILLQCNLSAPAWLSWNGPKVFLALMSSRCFAESYLGLYDNHWMQLLRELILLLRIWILLQSEKEVAGPTSLRTHSEDGTGNLSELNAKVTECYRICGRQEDSSVNAVAMMAFVEQALVDCLKKSSSIAPNLVEDWEKAREKERRQVLILFLIHFGWPWYRYPFFR